MNDPLLSLVTSPAVLPVAGMPGVFIRETSFVEVLAYFDRMKAADGDRAKYLEANVRIIIASVCDEKGVLKYSESDYDTLAKLPLQPMNLLTTAISTANGLSARAVEVDAKN